MKKKSFSLQKLPQISRIKKDKMIEKCKIFSDKIQQVQKIQNKAIQSQFLQNFFIRNKSKVLLTTYEQKNSNQKIKPKSLKKIQYDSIHQVNNIKKLKSNNQITYTKLNLLNQKNQQLKDYPIKNINSKFLNTFNINSNTIIGSATAQNILTISQSPIKNKINIQHYLQAKQTQRKKQQQQKDSFKKRNKLFLLDKVQTIQKTTYPIYLISNNENQVKQITFKKINENNYQVQGKNKVQIRLKNGNEKWIDVNRLKKRIYLNKDEIIKDQQDNKIKEDLNKIKEEKNISIKEFKFQLEKKNQYLQKQLQKIIKQYKKINNQTLSNQMIQHLKQQLYYNYYLSSQQFKQTYKNQRIPSFQPISNNKLIKNFQQIKYNLQNNLYCTYDLGFIDQYKLDKIVYIKQIIKSYSMINDIRNNFYHFQKLFVLNIYEKNIHQPRRNLKEFIEASRLKEQVMLNFNNKKNKLQVHIYKIQQHLKNLQLLIRNDIEKFIKFNPRFKENNYQHPLKIFCISLSKHLGTIVKSIIVQSIFKQFNIFVQYLKQWSINKYQQIYHPSFPNTQFYGQINIANSPLFLILQNKKQSQLILRSEKIYQLPKYYHAPGLIPITISLKRLKRRKYVNIYRFVIQSRKLIRQFKYNEDINQRKNNEFLKKMQKLQHFNNPHQKRIIYENPQQIMKSIVFDSIEQYFSLINKSQNINGCINNSLINYDFINQSLYIKGKQQAIMIIKQLQTSIILKYIKYFSLWQIYLNQKSYLQDFIELYRKLDAINLLKEEYEFLQRDLVIIENIPDIIEYKIIRININEVKSKIISTIQMNKLRILKQCENANAKMLQYGYKQNLKLKKLTKISNNPNLQQYIAFLALSNNRQIQKAIHRIALNILKIDRNIQFLQQKNHIMQIQTIKQYLECRNWIKYLRQKALQNKKKIMINPETFTKGIKQKKLIMYDKYFKILKDIIEIMKATELKKINRYCLLSENIQNQLNQICNMSNSIIQDQKLLNFQYQPQIIISDVGNNYFYKTDLTFFYIEKKYLYKFNQFWTFYLKLKLSLDQLIDKQLINIDSNQIVKIVRKGLQLIYKIKNGTLNKRFLLLSQEMNRQLEILTKNFHYLHLCITGSQTYRKKVLTYISNKLNIINCQVGSITLKNFSLWSFQQINLQDLLKMRQKQIQITQFYNKYHSFIQLLKFTEIKQLNLKIGQQKQINLLRVQNQLINQVKYFQKYLQIFIGKYNNMFKLVLNQADIQQLKSQFTQIQEAKKKCIIFSSFLQGFKKIVKFIDQNYSLFQIIIPIIKSSEQYFLFSYITQFQKTYQTLYLDAKTKSNLILKLNYSIVFNDKMKLNYNQQLGKLENFKILLFNDLFCKVNILQKFKKQKSLFLLLNSCNINNLKLILFEFIIGVNNINVEKMQKRLAVCFKGLKEVYFKIEQNQNQDLQYNLKFNQFVNIFKENFTLQLSFTFFKQQKQLKTIQKINKSLIQQQQLKQSHNQNTLTKKQQDSNKTQKQIKKSQTQKHHIKYNFNFGIIQHINFYYSSFQRICKYQFYRYFYLIYSCHFNIKKLFQVYLSFSDIIFQTLLTSLHLSFYLDLFFTFENKHDLSHLHSYLNQQLQTSYQCKQKQSQPFIEQIQLLIKQFKQICQYFKNIDNDSYQGQQQVIKMKKNIAFQFIPQVLMFQPTQENGNKFKKWLQGLKNQKEDEFLFYTHQSIRIIAGGGIFQTIEFNSIDVKEIQKKEKINFMEILKKANEFLERNKHHQKPQIKVYYPILKHLNLQNNFIEQLFRFYPITQLYTQQSPLNSYQKLYAFTIFKYSQLKNKIFISNIQINDNFLQKKFIKTYHYEYKPHVNQIIICIGENQLIKQIQKYLYVKQCWKRVINGQKFANVFKIYNSKAKYQKNQQFQYPSFKEQQLQLFDQSFIYFYCQQFSITNLQCLPFHSQLQYLFIPKYHYDHMVQKTSSIQKILISSFLKDPNNYCVLQNFKQRPQNINNNKSLPNRIFYSDRFIYKLPLEIKEKQQLRQLIWMYNNNNGLINANSIDQEIMYVLKLSNFIVEDIDLVKEAYEVQKYNVSTLRNLPQGFDFKNSIKAVEINRENLNNNINIKQQINLFVIPAYLYTLNDFIGFYQETTHSTIINDKFKLSLQHSQIYKKQTYIPGLLQKILDSIQTGIVNKDLYQFQFNDKILSSTQKSLQWYFIDLSVFNVQSQKLAEFMIKSLSYKNYFINGQGRIIHVNLHENKYHKIIYKLSSELIQKVTNKFQQMIPLPFIKYPDKFNPIKYLQLNLKCKIIKEFQQSNKMKENYFFKVNELLNKEIILQEKGKINLSNTQISTIQQQYKKKSIKLGQLFTKDLMKLLISIINIHLNEIRKYYIANGYYLQDQLTQYQSITNIYGATQLRQNTKYKAKQSSISSLYHVQQVQKYLDQKRKRLYKTLNQQKQINDYLKKSQQQKMLINIKYLGQIIIDQDNLFERIINITYFCILYCCMLQKQSIYRNNMINKIYKIELGMGNEDKLFRQIKKVIYEQINHNNNNNFNNSNNSNFNNNNNNSHKINNNNSNLNNNNQKQDQKIQFLYENLNDYYYDIVKNTWIKWQNLSHCLIDFNSCTNNEQKINLNIFQVFRLNQNINAVKKGVFQVYYQFIKNYNQISPQQLINFDYRNYFSKLFILYQYPYIWKLNNNQMNDMNIKKNILNMKYHYKQSHLNKSVYKTNNNNATYYYQHQYQLKFLNSYNKTNININININNNTNNNNTNITKRLNNLQKQLQYENNQIIIVNYNSLDQKQRQINKCIQQYNMLKINNIIEKLQSYHVFIYHQMIQDNCKQNQFQQYHHQRQNINANQQNNSKKKISSQNKQTLSPPYNYIKLLFIFQPSFVHQPNKFRQLFIGIILLCKNYKNQHIFNRIFRILQSINKFNCQSHTLFLYQLFRIHGINMKWKDDAMQQLQRIQIQNQKKTQIQIQIVSNIKNNNKIQISSQQFIQHKLFLIDLITHYSQLINTQNNHTIQPAYKQQIVKFIYKISQTFNLQQYFSQFKQYLNQENFVYLNKTQIKELLETFANLLFERVSKRVNAEYKSIIQANISCQHQCLVNKQEMRNMLRNYPPYILRYQLQKPKKYLTTVPDPLIKKKKNQKKINTIKPLFNDFLPFNRQLQQVNIKQYEKDFQIKYKQFTQNLIFYQTQQKFLLIKMKKPLSRQIYEKYVKSFKIYLKTKIMSKQKQNNNKVFSVQITQKQLKTKEFNNDTDDKLPIQIHNISYQKMTQKQQEIKYINQKDRLEYKFNVNNNKVINQNFISQAKIYLKNVMTFNEMGLQRVGQRKDTIPKLNQQKKLNYDTFQRKQQFIYQLNFLSLINSEQVDKVVRNLIVFENNRNLIKGKHQMESHYKQIKQIIKPSIQRKYFIFVPYQRQRNSSNNYSIMKQNNQVRYYQCQSYISSIVQYQINQIEQQQNPQILQSQHQPSFQIIQSFYNNKFRQYSSHIPIISKHFLFDKFLKFYQKLTTYFKSQSILKLQNNQIFQQYIKKCSQKLFKIKINTEQYQTQLEQKIDIISQAQNQHTTLIKQFDDNNQKLHKNQIQLNHINIHITQLSNKQTYYIGSKQFLDQNYKLRQTFTIKQLQKLILSEDYLKAENNINFYFIILFNVLADTTWVAERYEGLLEQEVEYQMNNGKQKLEDVYKKPLVKLVNYGRLTALIENQTIIKTDTITQQPLKFLINFTNKFIQLQSIFKKINQQSIIYSQQNPYSLAQICSQVNITLSQLFWKQPLKLSFHRYLLTFFIHKYIRLQIIKKSKQSKYSYDTLNTSIISLKNKKQQLFLQLNSTQNYLQTMNKKYQKNIQEIQISKNCQKCFIKCVENNVSKIAQMEIRLKSGMDVQIKYKFGGQGKEKIRINDNNQSNVNNNQDNNQDNVHNVSNKQKQKKKTRLIHSTSLQQQLPQSQQSKFQFYIPKPQTLLQFTWSILFPLPLPNQPHQLHKNINNIQQKPQQSINSINKIKNQFIQLLIYLQKNEQENEIRKLIQRERIQSIDGLYRTLRDELVRNMGYAVSYVRNQNDVCKRDAYYKKDANNKKDNQNQKYNQYQLQVKNQAKYQNKHQQQISLQQYLTFDQHLLIFPYPNSSYQITLCFPFLYQIHSQLSKQPLNILQRIKKYSQIISKYLILNNIQKIQYININVRSNLNANVNSNKVNSNNFNVSNNINENSIQSINNIKKFQLKQDDFINFIQNIQNEMRKLINKKILKQVDEKFNEINDETFKLKADYRQQKYIQQQTINNSYFINSSNSSNKNTNNNINNNNNNKLNNTIHKLTNYLCFSGYYSIINQHQILQEINIIKRIINHYIIHHHITKLSKLKYYLKICGQIVSSILKNNKITFSSINNNININNNNNFTLIKRNKQNHQQINNNNNLNQNNQNITKENKYIVNEINQNKYFQYFQNICSIVIKRLIQQHENIDKRQSLVVMCNKSIKKQQLQLKQQQQQQHEQQKQRQCIYEQQQQQQQQYEQIQVQQLQLQLQVQQIPLQNLQYYSINNVHNKNKNTNNYNDKYNNAKEKPQIIQTVDSLLLCKSLNILICQSNPLILQILKCKSILYNCNIKLVKSIKEIKYKQQIKQQISHQNNNLKYKQNWYVLYINEDNLCQKYQQQKYINNKYEKQIKLQNKKSKWKIVQMIKQFVKQIQLFIQKARCQQNQNESGYNIMPGIKFILILNIKSNTYQTNKNSNNNKNINSNNITQLLYKQISNTIQPIYHFNIFSNIKYILRHILMIHKIIKTQNNHYNNDNNNSQIEQILKIIINYLTQYIFKQSATHNNFQSHYLPSIIFNHQLYRNQQIIQQNQQNIQQFQSQSNYNNIKDKYNCQISSANKYNLQTILNHVLVISNFYKTINKSIYTTSIYWLLKWAKKLASYLEDLGKRKKEEVKGEINQQSKDTTRIMDKKCKLQNEIKYIVNNLQNVKSNLSFIYSQQSKLTHLQQHQKHQSFIYTSSHTSFIHLLSRNQFPKTQSKQLQAPLNKQLILQKIMKPKIMTQYDINAQKSANKILSDPYIYIVVNRVFRHLIARIIQKRNLKRLMNREMHIDGEKQSVDVEKFNTVKNVNSQIIPLLNTTKLCNFYYEFCTSNKYKLDDVILLIKGSDQSIKVTQTQTQKTKINKNKKSSSINNHLEKLKGTNKDINVNSKQQIQRKSFKMKFKFNHKGLYQFFKRQMIFNDENKNNQPSNNELSNHQIDQIQYQENSPNPPFYQQSLLQFSLYHRSQLSPNLNKTSGFNFKYYQKPNILNKVIINSMMQSFDNNFIMNQNNINSESISIAKDNKKYLPQFSQFIPIYCNGILYNKLNFIGFMEIKMNNQIFKKKDKGLGVFVIIQ